MRANGDERRAREGGQDRLRNYYLGYTGVFIALILVLALLERHGLPPRWIGYAFLFSRSSSTQRSAS